MITDAPVRRLADALVDRLLDADPLAGSSLGLRKYDALVPDPSAAAEQRLAADLADLAAQADGIATDDADDAATLDAVRGSCERHRMTTEMGLSEFSVTAMPFFGPPKMFAELARSALADPQAAADYLARVRGTAVWITGVTQRLREGAARGRFPVASLLQDAITWADRAMSDGPPAAIMAPAAPAGWDGADAWRGTVEQVARDDVAPALAGWREQLVELRAHARGDQAAGLSAVPGGEQIYANAIAAHTTLAFSAQELHRIGLDAGCVARGACPRARRTDRADRPGRGAGGDTRVHLRPRSARGAGRSPGRSAPRRRSRARDHARAVAGAVRSLTDAADRRRVGDGAALHPPTRGRHPAGDVLVQHPAAHRGYRLGSGGGRIPRDGAGASFAAGPAAAAGGFAATATAVGHCARRRLGPLRGAPRRRVRSVQRRRSSDRFGVRGDASRCASRRRHRVARAGLVAPAGA